MKTAEVLEACCELLMLTCADIPSLLDPFELLLGVFSRGSLSQCICQALQTKASHELLFPGSPTMSRASMQCFKKSSCPIIMPMNESTGSVLPGLNSMRSAPCSNPTSAHHTFHSIPLLSLDMSSGLSAS